MYVNRPGGYGTIPKPTSTFGNPATYTAAADTQASDYDRIMKQYADLTKSFSENPLTTKPINFTPITPQTTSYSQSPDVTRSLSDLSELANTGGYSEADKQDIRERDISPIRSVYANAQENIDRQRRLSGGYSPNFNAVTTKMSREEADKIGDITTKANADIAENVARNRLSASGSYAGASATANAAKTAADQRNADIINQINEANAARKSEVDRFNAQAELEAGRTNRSDIINTISGQASLYGTTPALVNTFGNQVVQANQLGQAANARKWNTIGSFGR